MLFIYFVVHNEKNFDTSHLVSQRVHVTCPQAPDKLHIENNLWNKIVLFDSLCYAKMVKKGNIKATNI